MSGGDIPGHRQCVHRTKPDITPECDSNGPHININPETGECSCNDGYQLSLNQCICPAGFHTDTNGECEFGSAPTTEIPERTILPTKKLFELNSAELTQNAEQVIQNFATDVQNKQGNDATYCITVNGYTDTSGTSEYNQALSTQRAQAVKTALIAAKIPEANIKATGHGETNCKYDNDTPVPDGTIYPKCRRVEIGFTDNACQK